MRADHYALFYVHDTAELIVLECEAYRLKSAKINLGPTRMVDPTWPYQERSAFLMGA